MNTTINTTRTVVLYLWYKYVFFFMTFPSPAKLVK